MRSTLLSAQGSNAFAEMTELADVQDLGSCAIRREGSSPFFRMRNVYSFPGDSEKNTRFGQAFAGFLLSISS